MGEQLVCMSAVESFILKIQTSRCLIMKAEVQHFLNFLDFSKKFPKLFFLFQLLLGTSNKSFCYMEIMP